MDVRITPQPLAGTVCAIASKSIAHRLLVCAALADKPCVIDCAHTSDDIMATVSCLRALGARITQTKTGFRVVPLKRPHGLARHLWHPTAQLYCNESGSTLRFMLPVVCALGTPAALYMQGKLPKRPLSPLYEQLVLAGARLSPQGNNPLVVAGSIRPQTFYMPGNISSQYISGLLMAAPLLNEEVRVVVTKPVESRPYIQLTLQAMKQFGVIVQETEELDADKNPVVVYTVDKDACFCSCEEVSVEGDWSNAAFWLCAGAVGGSGLTVDGLNLTSAQGDRAIMAALARFGTRISRKKHQATAVHDHISACDIDVAHFPDLVPPLAVVASVGEGTTTISGAARLRIKESDRLQTVCAGLTALGADIRIVDDSLVIQGVPQLTGGVVDAAHDHRIAMMTAIAATRCMQDVIIKNASCVSKSYPQFFEDYQALGGQVHVIDES